MNFNLDKDLVFFDIESTGIDVVSDRIIQIALVKYPKGGGTPIEKDILMNPQYPIKPEAMKVHGITVDMVRNKPTFQHYAAELMDFFKNADLAGYNLKKFDIPMLVEEFARVGMEFNLKGRRIIDALQIFYKMEPRTLKAALKFYCNKNMTDAHNALADTRATAEVLWGQIVRYDGVDYIDKNDQINPSPIKNDMQAIHDFLDDSDVVDATGRFKKNDAGVIVLNFGANRGEEAHKHPNTLKWILEKDFPVQVKTIAKAILDGKIK